MQIYTAKLYKDKKMLKRLRTKERLLLMKEIDYLKNKEANALHEQQKKARSYNASSDRIHEMP